jgi:hypothetical protein
MSPGPHLHTSVLSELFDACLNAKREFELACPGLQLTDPPDMPATLCDNNIPIGDSRRTFAFKAVIQKLEAWTNSCEAAVKKLDKPDFNSNDQAGLGAAKAAKKTKRSTVRGEARSKLIAAFTEHHRYANESCLNSDPIGNNALADLAEVSVASASAFFKKEFEGHLKYRNACRKPTSLLSVLKLLNQDYPAHILLQDASQVAAEDVDAE